MCFLQKIFAHIYYCLYHQSLRFRLQTYLSLLIIILVVCLFFLVLFVDIFPLPDETIKSEIEKGLRRYNHTIKSYFNNTAAHGIRFSKMAVVEIEKLLKSKNISFAHIANNQELIKKLQCKVYDILYRTMIFAPCSGSFIIFDTTVNTNLPNSENSRSGMYLKLMNLRTPTPDNHEMVWLRGIARIGTQNSHFIHNKWELEFSLKNLPFYKKLKDHASAHYEESFFFSPRIKLPGTWETMMLLCVPMVGSNGEFYGVCGLEISSMYFKLAHLVGNGGNERAIGLVARHKNGWILPATGLESGTVSGYYAGLDAAPLRIENISDGLKRFISNASVFVGMEIPITLSPLFPGDEWSIAYLIPERDYNIIIKNYYIKAILSCIIFIFIALLVSYLLSRRYINTLLNSINAVKNGSTSQTNIVEIDSLIKYLNNKNVNNTHTTHVDMSGFYIFKDNIKKLSPAERLVFNLYLEDFSSQKIADTLCISIHTVKSHNKNIYAKLGVSSRKELMIYIKMLKG